MCNWLGPRVQPDARHLIPTGLHMAVAEGFEIQIRPRSGLALTYEIALVHAPGTIDSAKQTIPNFVGFGSARL